MTAVEGVRIGAVVTDLDGTVVRRDRTVSPATLRAAAALEARGIPLIAATARTPLGLKSLSTLVPHLAFAVCCSGAVGHVPASGATAWFDVLPRVVIADLIRTVKAAAVFDGDEWRMTAAYRTMRPTGHQGRTSVVDAAALTEVEACSMVLCHPHRTAAELVADLITAGFGPERVTLTYAGPRFVEVTAPSVDKASGVARALRTIGVPPAQTIAFGDMPIDIPMFSAVGHSVAMADAPPAVLAAATFHTENAENDGFAHMLTRLGILPA
ncbi:HAD family hydrolase [Actinoplanes sp. NPDC051470]|uniref:HAD family hydrolase n=1 Tax=unclassified Actinoplanes TaxID=2626549 RepID=UPI003427C57B